MKPKIPFVFILFSLIPPLHFLTVLGSIVLFFGEPSLKYALLFFVSVYAAPPLIYRIVSSFWRVKVGTFPLTDKKAWPWLFAIKLQIFYIAFPVFEQILILFPELYSFWLRLWGSKIGKFVVWSHQAEVLDRTHLNIGNYVLIGHRAMLSCHAIKSDNGGLETKLTFAPITIADRVVVAGYSAIGPGVKVKEAANLPFREILYPYEKFPRSNAVHPSA